MTIKNRGLSSYFKMLGRLLLPEKEEPGTEGLHHHAHRGLAADLMPLQVSFPGGPQPPHIDDGVVVPVVLLQEEAGHRGGRFAEDEKVVGRVPTGIRAPGGQGGFMKSVRAFCQADALRLEIFQDSP